ncbi:type II toxin-antitoxin system RelE/ParE family toxin, partial [bacterium]|nr:type II toxin-antitoxin system RelE/ParE family toxin [bacterium]
DRQIHVILNNPEIGQEKRGELRGVFVHKFKIHATQYLLAYRIKENEILELIMIGPHENYYRDLAKYTKDSK